MPKGAEILYHILIIEDDLSLNRGISLALKDTDREIHSVYDLAGASAQIKASLYDLLILDIKLPDGSGLDFLTSLRRQSTTPVILLTANDLEMDVVTGFELGADDYITKPFSLAILRARVEAQLRRNHTQNRYDLDGYLFDFDTLKFEHLNQPVELSRTEQKLLRLLLENRGRTVQRELLMDRVWSDAGDFVDENALSVAIKRLRDKLGASAAGKIKTVYGVGYTWTAD